MKRHSLDVLSLVFGLIFLMVALSWIVRRSWNLELPGAGWFIAAALIVGGLFGIVSSFRSNKPISAPPPAPAEQSPEDRPF